MDLPMAPLVRIVDDDASYMSAIARLLRASGFRVKGYSSGYEFLAGAEFEQPGCVILDLQMPGMSGLDIQEAIQLSGSRLPIVFLSGHGDIPTTVQAMRRGAEDFLTKQAAREDVLEAVSRAIARDARQRSERAHRAEVRALFTTLTPRELEVLQRVVAGRLNKQIAYDLGLHERTIKLHRTSIKAKLKVDSTPELTMLWVEFQNSDTTPR